MSSSEVDGNPSRQRTPEVRRPDRWLARRGGLAEFLWAPAALFGAILRVRSGLYDRGWLPTTRLEVPVVSVGNLTAGGTGKTPFVAFLARELSARGWRPGILSRGYGAKQTRDGALANDEACMLARELAQVPHLQSPDRVSAGRSLVQMGVDVVLLDDGFQHRRLVRDLDLVLVDATRPWGLPRTELGPAVRALLPRGLLRERPASLRRAHAVVITRVDLVSAEALTELEEELTHVAPGLPILTAEHRPVRLLGPEGPAHPSALRGRPVELVSALGNPDAFEACVRKLGAEIVSHRAFPDHHAYAAADLDGLGTAGRWIVTTAKDAVKLPELQPGVRVLEVELALTAGRAVLDALLSALPAGRPGLQRRNLHEGLHG